MNGYAMNTDNHYPQRQQQQQQQQHWPPHLLQPPFPSPTTEHYSYYQQDRSSEHRSTSNNPAATALSLNLSSLTVASPTNLSPINPPPTSSGPSALSPVTPISPSATFQQQLQHHHHHHPHHHIQQQSPFQFDPASPSYETNPPPSPLVQPTPSTSGGGYDTRRTPALSRSSSSSGIASSTSLPRKRSFTGSNSTGPSPTSTSNPSSSVPPPPPPTPHHPRNQNQGLTLNVNVPTSSSSSSSTSTTAPSSSTSASSTSTTTLLEEEEPMLYDDEARDAAMDLASSVSYDDIEVRNHYGVVGMGMSNHHNTHTHSLATHGHHALAHGMGINFAGSGGMGSGNGSPVDGSGSTSGAEDTFGAGAGAGGGGGGMLNMGGSMNILGKPLATNNFVTKLYQMINDPKSTQFIAWTELGTSFVVSNVGEFSRSILGSHFKHNNFSSFVRQLNMYGFHKINRTPRAQRTSTDAQTWEFSHIKFLRGRPDLLDEIKRKALEPDPTIKHRVELPGEVAAQLGAMRDENRRMWDQLTSERRKVEKLVSVVGRLWDVVGKGFPGSVPQFPSDLLETADSPNIYITSPTTSISSSRFPPPLSMNINMMHTLNSPNSSPTTSDFQQGGGGGGGGHYHHHHQQHHSHHHQQQQLPHHLPHSVSRQHGFQHGGGGGAGYSRTGDSNASTPLPSSPGSISMDLFDDGTCEPPPSGRSSTKRQRLNDEGVGVGVNGINTGSVINVGGGGGIAGLVGGGGGGGAGGAGNAAESMSLLSSVSSPGTGGNNGLATLTVPKKSSRARSDSAPLGYGSTNGLMHSWQQQQGGMGASGGGGVGVQGNGSQNGMGRPRSGSGMVPRIGMGMGSRSGNASTPLLSITTVESDMGGHPR